MSGPSLCVLQTESYYQFIYLGLNEDCVSNKAVQRSFAMIKLHSHQFQLLQHSVSVCKEHLYYAIQIQPISVSVPSSYSVRQLMMFFCLTILFSHNRG